MPEWSRDCRRGELGPSGRLMHSSLRNERLPGYMMVLNWRLAPGGAGGVNQVVLQLARQLRAGADFVPYIAAGFWDRPTEKQYAVEGFEQSMFRIRDPLAEGPGWKVFIAFLLT